MHAIRRYLVSICVQTPIRLVIHSLIGRGSNSALNFASLKTSLSALIVDRFQGHEVTNINVVLILRKKKKNNRNTSLKEKLVN